MMTLLTDARSDAPDTGLMPAIARPTTREWFWDVIVPFVATRAVLLVIGLVAARQFPSALDFAHHPTRHAAINIWSQWDADWYLSIAHRGYSLTPGRTCNAAFPPLYSILMWLGGCVTGHDVAGLLLSGVAVSNAALLAAMTYLYMLARLDYERGTAARTVFYMLAFPSTLFLSAVYNLSLFLALLVASFYYARQRRWAVAGLLAGLLALTRVDGCMCAVALGFEYLYQVRFRWRDLRADALWLVACPLAAVIGWLVYQKLKLGNALAFVVAQKAWGPTGLSAALHGLRAPVPLAFTLMILALLCLSLFYMRPSYVMSGLASFVPMVLANRPSATRRYALLLFPVFLVMGHVGRHPWVDRLLLFVCATFASIFMTRFALGYFVA